MNWGELSRYRFAVDSPFIIGAYDDLYFIGLRFTPRAARATLDDAVKEVLHGLG